MSVVGGTVRACETNGQHGGGGVADTLQWPVCSRLWRQQTLWSWDDEVTVNIEERNNAVASALRCMGVNCSCGVISSDLHHHVHAVSTSSSSSSS